MCVFLTVCVTLIWTFCGCYSLSCDQLTVICSRSHDFKSTKVRHLFSLSEWAQYRSRTLVQKELQCILDYPYLDYPNLDYPNTKLGSLFFLSQTDVRLTTVSWNVASSKCLNVLPFKTRKHYSLLSYLIIAQSHYLHNLSILIVILMINSVKMSSSIIRIFGISKQPFFKLSSACSDNRRYTVLTKFVQHFNLPHLIFTYVYMTAWFYKRVIGIQTALSSPATAMRNNILMTNESDFREFEFTLTKPFSSSQRRIGIRRLNGHHVVCIVINRRQLKISLQ